jgi:hypothetical protein
MAKDTVSLRDESPKSPANGETVNCRAGHAPGTRSLQRRAFLRNMSGSALASVLGMPKPSRSRDFKAAAPEPYVAMREVYIQHRNKQIKE